MKLNKKLSAAITLSLMLGMYGSASAEDRLYGASADKDVSTISKEVVNRDSTHGVTNVLENATNIGATYTVISGLWENVYGGYINEGNANNNIVNVAGGKMSCVQGGFTINKGNAEENRVTVTGGEMFWVIGGFSGGDSTKPESFYVSGNIVDISGTTVVRDDVTGGSIQDGEARNNNAIVTGGTIGADVHGGEVAIQGDATGNTVSINGASASATDKVQITGSIYGGKTAKGEANNNKVGKINSTGALVGAATNFSAGNLIGGKGTIGAAGNEVWLGEGANVESNVLGGYTEKSGDLENNIVNIDGSIVAGNVYGGDANTQSSDVFGNIVTISAGTIGTVGNEYTGYVYGGYTMTGGTYESYGSAYSNVVNVTGGTITNTVVGGKADNGTAGGSTVDKGNQVNISGGYVGGAIGGSTTSGSVLNNRVTIQGAATIVNGDVYGGKKYNDSDLVSNNIVTIANGSITGNVYGAYTGGGTIGYQKSTDGSITGEGNIVNLSGGSITGDVYGGKSESNQANGNKVGTEDAAATNFTATNVYGGRGRTGAEGNEVWLGTGANITGDVTGGFVWGANANATANTVKIVGAVTVADDCDIIGNYAFNGSTIGYGEANVAIIDSNVHAYRIYGGYGDSEADGNTVTINGAGSGDTERVKISSLVQGGASISSNATNNKVGTADNAATNFTSNDVYGGSGKTGATGNEVWLGAGAVVADSVYGGYTKDGTAGVTINDDGSTSGAGNIVSIKGAGASATDRVQINGTVYGGYSENGQANGNKVGTSEKPATNFTAAGVYGGLGLTGAASNEVWLGEGAEVTTGNVGGGLAWQGNATSNTVTINSSNVGTTDDLNSGHVYGGYASNYGNADGNADGNQVTISGNSNITNEVYGGYAKVGTAGITINSDGGTSGAGNIVSINGTSGTAKVKIGTYDSSGKITAGGYVYGGYSANGAANGNKVGQIDSTGALVGAATNFSAGNLIGGKGTTGAAGNEVWLGAGADVSEVYGGYASAGNATSNEVTISGNSNITKKVNGGYVNDGGAANQNTVVIEGGNTGSVTGGEVFTTASGYDNTANFNTVTISGGEIVGTVTGGTAKSGNLTKVKGFANDNEVKISKNAVINGSVYGGNTVIGDTARNKITVSDNVNVTGNVYGARIQMQGNAELNSVTISGGTIGSNEDFVYGGYTAEGKATSNTVTITNGTISSIVIGGKDDSVASSEKVTDGNKVIIKGGTVNNAVYGGSSANNNALNNSVEIDGSSAQITGNVYGGSSWGSAGIAKSNEVNVKNGTLNKDVLGGFSGAYNVEENTVNVSGGTISGDVYGGDSNNGDATSNTVTISGGTIEKSVYGGSSEAGAVDNNTVTISGGATVVNRAYAGYTKTGDAGSDQGNKLIIKDGKVTWYAFAGYSEEGNVKNNIAVIEGGTAYTLYGGRSIGTAAGTNMVSDNSATVNGGTTDYAIGGGSTKYNVTKNTATIQAGSTKYLYGGLSDDGIVGAEDAANRVFVEGGEVTEIAAGGYSDNIANYNEATVSAGKVKVLAGGYSEYGAANNNKVTISGGEVKEAVYGGKGSTSATDNIVNISGSAKLDDAEVYGGAGAISTGNTLNIDTWTGSKTMKSINDFQAINVTDTRDINVGDADGLANDGVVLKIIDSTLDMSTLVKGDEIVYLKKTAGSDDFYGKFSAAELNGYAKGEGAWNGAKTGFGVEANKAEFQIDKEKAFVSITENLLTGNLVDESIAEELVLGSSAAAYENIYGAYSAKGTATAATVNMNVKDADLSSSTVWGNNVSAAGNALNVTVTGVKVKGLKNFETMNVDLSAGVADGDKILIVNSEVEVKAVAISGLDAASLNKGDSVEVLNATDIKAGQYTLDGTKVADGDVKGYTSANANGVKVDRVAFAADTTKVALTKEAAILTGKYIDKDGAETAAELVLDNGAAAYENIYGAYAEKGDASGANVNMDKPVDLSASTIYGNNAAPAGNTLNVKANGSKVKALKNFENMNFYIPADAKAGDTMIEVGSDVDLTNVNVAAGFHNDTALGYGDKVKLINAPAVSGLDGVSEVKVDDTDFTQYDVMIYQGDASMNEAASGATTLVAELANTELKENAKVLAETTMAAVSVIGSGSDLMAGAGFDSAISAIAADMENGASSGSMSIFGAINGDKAKVKSGSHVDVKSWNMNLGFAKEVANKSGKVVIAPVVEYGRGNFDSYLDNGYHGEGNTHFVGGGLMAKQINNNGNYFEGSLRAGKVSNEFKASGGSYDSDSKYLAGHIGVGHVVKVNAKNSMDYYAKFFHTHLYSDATTVDAKGKPLNLKLESTNSDRLRIGGRLNHKVGSNNYMYAGLAWQREFSGLGYATLEGQEIIAPSIKGNTGIMELGWKLSESNKYDLDLGATGSVGKKKGAGLSLNFNWKF